MSLESINARLQTALYFHREQADLFNFLGLHGFHALHEHQYWDEAKTARKLKNFVISNCGRIIFDDPPRLDEIKLIPNDWLEADRLDVTGEAWAKYVKKSFEMYYQWEKDTCELYEESASEYLKDGKLADYHFIMKLVEDVSNEKAKVTDIVIVLQGCRYDLPTIVDMQDDLWEKYGKELKQEQDKHEDKEHEERCKCKHHRKK